MGVSDQVRKFIKIKKLSNIDVANAMDMPASTFSSKLSNNTFTAEEIILISQILGINLSSFSAQANCDMMISIRDKTKTVKSYNAYKDLTDAVCTFQLKSANGDGMYVIGAIPNGGSHDLLLIEDWDMRNEIVLRVRTIEKVYQFTFFGFDNVEAEDIPVTELLEGLMKKRNITAFTPKEYIKDMSIRWCAEVGI